MSFVHSFFGARKITKNMNSVPHGATQKATKTVLPALWSHYKKQRRSRCCFLVFEALWDAPNLGNHAKTLYRLSKTKVTPSTNKNLKF